MKKNKLFSFIILSLLLSIHSSCDLEEVNIDPGNATRANLNLILPGAQAQMAFNQSAVSARISGIVMQQFFGFDAQQVGYNDYFIGTDEFNSFWGLGLYSGSMKSANQVIQEAGENGNLHFRGMSRIILAHELLHGTALFGDIPYTEALQRNANLKPVYDTQEQLMRSISTLLDEGISDLSGEDPSGFVPSSDDLIYGGDVTAWIKLAHGLKARALMMQQKRGASMDAILAEVNASFGSNAENASFPWESGLLQGNPLAKFAVDRTGTLRADGRLYRRMTAINDPRRDFYIVATPGETDTAFNAFVRGAGLTWMETNSPIPLLSFGELKFIQAEAMARKGESSDAVSAVLKEAIDASVELVTGSVDETFSTSMSDLSGLSGDQVIQRIIEQAYYAYYGIGFQQAWSNYRRTGYPILTPSPGGVNGFNPSGVIPRRWLYPEDERLANSANLGAAIMRQGGHLLDNDMWLFE